MSPIDHRTVDPPTLAHLLLEHRERNHISIAALERHLGISRKTLIGYLRGDTAPERLATRKKIADYLNNVSVNHIGTEDITDTPLGQRLLPTAIKEAEQGGETGWVPNTPERWADREVSAKLISYRAEAEHWHRKYELLLEITRDLLK